MPMRERLIWLGVVLMLVALTISSRTAPPERPPVSRPRAEPGTRLTMDALHAQGGTPLGWQLALPPGNVAAGRAAFADLGCASCHRIAGEPGADAAAQPGPELTGMGSHHPRAYFAEAIVNPDAVLIDAPGYIGADGHSTMPAYPDLTVGELSDLVAYLASLTDTGTGAAASCHDPGAGSAGVTMTSVDLSSRPQPPQDDARAFFTQSYDVLPGRLAEFERWFATEGRPRFFSAEGLTGIDTFVDLSRSGAVVTSVFSFRDESALRSFLGDPAMVDVFARFDAFVGPHGHRVTDRPVVYRVPGLSGMSSEVAR